MITRRAGASIGTGSSRSFSSKRRVVEALALRAAARPLCGIPPAAARVASRLASALEAPQQHEKRVEGARVDRVAAGEHALDHEAG